MARAANAEAPRAAVVRSEAPGTWHPHDDPEDAGGDSIWRTQRA
jgi:hypothetical protein